MTGTAFASKYGNISCDKTTFFKTFDKKGNFHIGRKMLKTVWSKLVFLIVSSTTACLKQTGTNPLTKLLLKRDWIVVPKRSNRFNSSRGGIGSDGRTAGSCI